MRGAAIGRQESRQLQKGHSSVLPLGSDRRPFVRKQRPLSLLESKLRPETRRIQTKFSTAGLLRTPLNLDDHDLYVRSQLLDMIQRLQREPRCEGIRS